MYDNDYRRGRITTNDPVKAVEMWFRFQKKYPMGVAILGRNRKEACELVDAITPEMLADFDAKYPVSYKLDWLTEWLERAQQTRCSSFYEGEFGDIIGPFSYG